MGRSAYGGRSSYGRGRLASFAYGRPVPALGDVRTAILNSSLLLTTLDMTKVTIPEAAEDRQGRCAWACFSCLCPIMIDRMFADAQGAYPGVEAMARTCFLGSSVKLEVMNALNEDCEVEIYRVRLRKDIPVETRNGVTTPPFGQNCSILKLDTTSFMGTTATADVQQLRPVATTLACGMEEYSFTPYMSALPRVAKIRRVLKKRLKPGQSFNFSAALRQARLWSQSDFDVGVLSSTGSSQIYNMYRAVRAAGPIYYIKLKGTVVHYESGNPTTMAANPILPGNALVNITLEGKYRWKNVQETIAEERAVGFVSSNTSAAASFSTAAVGTTGYGTHEEQWHMLGPTESAVQT